MKIKSLLFGSAAALVAATGAKAADAIVIAEPEPVEYVRVCDAYGAGFFYIPGTETCMRIGGEIRFQIGGASDENPFRLTYTDRHIFGFPFIEVDTAGTDTPNYHGYTAGGWTNKARARVFVDVRSDTEWGTLQGYVRMQFDRDSGSVPGSSTVANHAWLSLGGLRMGWTDSAWSHTPNGGQSNFGSHSDNGLRYGYYQRNLLQYNFSGGNGFFATLSLEDDDGGTTYGKRTATGPGTGFFFGTPEAGTPMNPFWAPAYTNNNYVPDVVVRAGVSQGWGALWGAVAYDEDRTNNNSVLLSGSWYDTTPGPGGLFPVIFALGDQIGKSGWAAQLGVQINVPNAPGSSLRVMGFYADSDNAYNGHGGEWSVLASYGHRFSPQWFASVGAQYTDSLYISGTDIKTDDNRWDLELNAVWEPVQNFQVRGEAVYSKQTDLDGTWSGFLRFSRFF